MIFFNLFSKRLFDPYDTDNGFDKLIHVFFVGFFFNFILQCLLIEN
jgi:hypothetical protein